MLFLFCYHSDNDCKNNLKEAFLLGKGNLGLGILGGQGLVRKRKSMSRSSKKIIFFFL